MKLVLLGTTGYHPNDRRQTACFMLPEIGVVLDAGTGMYRVRQHLCTPTLDIYLTHAHLDHIFGLTFLFDVLNGRKMDRVTVHGKPEKLQAIQEHLLSSQTFPVKLPCEYRPLAEGPMPLPEGGVLKHFPLVHPGGSIGYRLDWPGHSFAYVTDTMATADASYISHIQGVDLLIHECYFPDGQEEWAKITGHSCTTPVAQLAKAAGVGRLILVHMNPLVEDEDPIKVEVAQKIFPATQLGADRMELSF